MTRLPFFLTIVLLVCTCGSGWAEGNLVAHWDFDGYVTGGTLTEQTGNISPATVVGSMALAPSAPPATVGYDFGDAIFFDGVDDEIVIPEAPQLRIAAGSFSISFMWKQAAGVSTAAGTNRGGTLLIKGFISNTDGGRYYRIKQQDDRLWLSCDDATTPDPTDGVWAKKEIQSATGETATLMDDTWHHVVFVRDVTASSLFIYRDGEENAALPYTIPSPQTGDIDAPGLPLRLGVDRDAADAPGTFAGPASVDDLRIYDGALSQEEIINMYLATPTPEGPQDARAQTWEIYD